MAVRPVLGYAGGGGIVSQEPPRPDYDTLAHELDLCHDKPLGMADMFSHTRWLEVERERLARERHEVILAMNRADQKWEAQVEALTKERDLHVRVFADVQADRDESRAQVELWVKDHARLFGERDTALSALRACRDALEHALCACEENPCACTVAFAQANATLGDSK